VIKKGGLGLMKKGKRKDNRRRIVLKCPSSVHIPLLFVLFGPKMSW
jgi:hypothetical protein